MVMVAWALFDMKACCLLEDALAAQTIVAWNCMERPRIGGVCNLASARRNSISILEAFDRIKTLSGIPMVDANLKATTVLLSDLGKMRCHYPWWNITKSLDEIYAKIFEATLPQATLTPADAYGPV